LPPFSRRKSQASTVAAGLWATILDLISVSSAEPRRIPASADAPAPNSTVVSHTGVPDSSSDFSVDTASAPGSIVHNLCSASTGSCSICLASGSAACQSTFTVDADHMQVMLADLDVALPKVLAPRPHPHKSHMFRARQNSYISARPRSAPCRRVRYVWSNRPDVADTTALATPAACRSLAGAPPTSLWGWPSSQGATCDCGCGRTSSALRFRRLGGTTPDRPRGQVPVGGARDSNVVRGLRHRGIKHRPGLRAGLRGEPLRELHDGGGSWRLRAPVTTGWWRLLVRAEGLVR